MDVSNGQPDLRLLQRLITHRLSLGDGSEEILFECGHTAIQFIPFPKEWTRMWCAQCINEFVDEFRVKQTKGEVA